MKSLHILFAAMILAATISSCKKDNKTVAPSNNLPNEVNKIFSQAILDTLKKNGTVINAGNTPPTISNTYLLSPDNCTFDSSHFHEAGDLFSDYNYTFTGQNNSKQTIKVFYSDPNQEDVGADTTATFISGSGNLFSVFVDAKGIESGITYERLEVISGEVSSAGIKNFQLTLYFLSKGSDPNGVLVENGSMRIFEDGDGLSPIVLSAFNPKQPVKSFSLSANTVNKILTTMGRKNK